MESRATRARPAALERSSSTISWRRSRVSPDPPISPIMPEAISLSSATAFFIFMSEIPRFRLSIFSRAALMLTSRARISSV